jgi:hypothetical protein
MRLSRTHWLLGAFAAVAIAGATRAAEPAAPAETGKPIDVVICLDCSNSMDGLIASAKIKLWDIVNDLAKVKPSPVLRVALYSYGNDTYNPAVGWVRKELDLTRDLDEVYSKLNALTTKGGTEYVARVTRDALNDLKWSNDKSAFKVIFVAGNEPASQDPDVKLQAVAEMAKKQGVVINPIYCGGANDGDARDWRDFAALAGGRFSNIDQNGGTVAIATPHDKELAELSVKLNTTYVAYGKEGKEKLANQTVQDANAAKLSPVAAANRGTTKGGALYCTSDWDIIDRMKRDPKFDVTQLKDDELSDELRKMKPDERVAFVKKKAEERDAIQKEIDVVSAKRLKCVEEVLRKNKTTADKAFDVAIRATLREQAAACGIKIPE